jgi:hypothetical protein
MQKLGNTSSAVMEQRAKPRNEGLDDFPTPTWQVRAFIEHALLPRFGSLKGMTALEPCCNRGFMARPMAEYFGEVFTADVKHYGWTGQQHTGSFLFPDPVHPRVAAVGVDWIFFNAPFRLGLEFIERALQLKPRVGIAALTRVAFVEGVERYERLFRDTPPTLEVQPAERVPMVEGRYDPKASTATCYRWLVWMPGRDREPTQWLPPCKAKFFYTSDVAWEQGEG